jgi:CheY-like chemotaxis protein
LNEYHQNRIADECEQAGSDDLDRKSDQKHRLASEYLREVPNPWRKNRHHQLPPVMAPQRLGFGSTVTSSMIKMSTDGKVSIDYAPSGLVWRLLCQNSKIVERASPYTHAEAVSATSMNRPSGRRRILVVEDEALTAAAIQSSLSAAGFDVIGPAASVSQALALMDRGSCDAAVLDISLGNETSEPIARKLTSSGTPFVVVTGYSRARMPEIYRAAPFIRKPLTSAALMAELKRCMEANHPRLRN